MDSDLREILQRPGHLVLPSNLSFREDLAGVGGHATRRPSGHLIFYGPHGRRILATDPEGNPLHECEWTVADDGGVVLARARFRLDWGRWVGLGPGGMVRSTTLDLSSKPGYQRLTADDLRRMASHAMGLSFEEVRFFYPDEDLAIGADGMANIRHRKDAFYILDDGTFDRAHFMACMGAMHWQRIDFLPVVELFQSLLPGTGSAALELIRGLYDDQNRHGALPLHYRGIPTYPSEAAFRLFSAFFSPSTERGGNPLPLFTDQARSHEVTWLPAPESPLRYFDTDRRLCVTIKGGSVSKLTLADDPSGLPFTPATSDGLSPYGRRLEVVDGEVVLHDGDEVRRIPARPSWGQLLDTRRGASTSLSSSWRSLLGDGLQTVVPERAFSAVLLYPDDETEIGERSSQLFAADYVQDLFDQDRGLLSYLARARRVLIDNVDGALASCVYLDSPREHTIVYGDAPLAQKCAQTVWNQLAVSGRLDWCRNIQFVPDGGARAQIYQRSYDLVYAWMPFAQFNEPAAISAFARQLAGVLAPGGLACAVGPAELAGSLESCGLKSVQRVAIQDLPSFRMHQTILPKSRLKPGLTLFILTA